MTLFWKLFCSMVSITVLACSLGGFVLIDGQLRASLSQEVQALYEENDMLRYALSHELERRTITHRDELSQLVGSVIITAGGRTMTFRLSGADGRSLGASGVLNVDAAPLTASLAENQRGWALERSTSGGMVLHGASALRLLDETVYLENCRDVTPLYAQRTAQYQSFTYGMLALTAAAGVLSLLVSHLICRPLARLSAAARSIAEGAFDQRVPVTSNDELGRLSEDFNAMALRLEEQVAQLTAAAQREKDFTASFAHEIKTPLTSIIGYADLLLSRPVSPDQVHESAGYIFHEGRRLESLSRKLMDLIIMDRQAPILRPVPLCPFLDQTASALRPAMTQAGLTLDIEAEDAVIHIDPDLIETACLNLLDNARKATPPGGRIVITGRKEEDGRCLIQVTDPGHGIPPKDLPRITEPFYMSDKSRARAQGGAGLGLALCQKIVTLHGGTLEFESTPGVGTTVRIRL